MLNKDNIELLKSIDTSLISEFDDIITRCKSFNIKANTTQIEKAFIWCIKANRNTKRESGEPSYRHNIEVVKIIIDEIHLDETSIIVGFIYNSPHRGEEFGIKPIRKEFNSTIAQIVEGLLNIRTLEDEKSAADEHLENFRKLIISMTTDVRIILVKLAIRLHNMRTLQYLDLGSQKEFSNETMEVYVPFANRFGLRNLVWKLEDLSFKFINTEAYQDIKSRLSSTRKERENYVDKFTKPVKKLLARDSFFKANKIEYTLSGRAKHIYSIFNKMILRGKPMEELYDLTAIRLIINYEDPLVCFYAYGLIASIYQPILETFKDYINAPKKNGYQSLHFAVLGPQRRPVEVQIRTMAMHEFAEEGMAAHFKYKRGLLPANTVFEEANVSSWIDSMRDIFDNRSSLSSSQILDSIKKNLFFEEINVFTPDNEMLTLPKDASVLDFAFEVHTDIGSKTLAAKINNLEVPIDTKLRSGDQVEIITQKDVQPQSIWLDYVITPKAKSGINKYIKLEKKKKIAEGTNLWWSSLKKEEIELNDLDFRRMYREMNFREAENFFLALANNEITIEKTIDYLKYKLKYGFEKENRDEKSIGPGFLSTLIVKGKKRNNLIPDIIKMMIETDVVIIESINSEEFDLNIECKITFTFESAYNIQRLINKLYQIQGITSVRQVR